MKLTSCAVLLAGAAAVGAAGIANADCLMERPWTLRAGVHNVDPSGNSSTIDNGALPVKVDSQVTPTINVQYKFCKYFQADVLGALPVTHDIVINGEKLGSTRELPPTVSVQYHPLAFAKVDPFVGVGVNRTFFFNEALNGPLAGNNLQLSNTWGIAGQVGVDGNFGGHWVVGVDARYMQIEPNASLNGAPLGKVKVDPLAYGVNVGYRFGF
jgi:outer membrane protein